MHTGTESSIFKLSSESAYGVSADSAVVSGRSNFPSSCQSQTSRNTDFFSVSAQDHGHKTLTLPPEDTICSHNLPPSYSEDSDGLRKVDDIKSHKNADQRNSIESNKGALRSQSVHIIVPGDKCSGFKELSLDDELKINEPRLRKHRKTEPNMTMKKRAVRESVPLFFPPSQWSARYGIQFFTVVIPKVSIINDNDKGSKGSYAQYILETKRGRQVIKRNYRYSQFAEFHKLLLRSSVAIIVHQARIYLPPRTWFKNTSASFLDNRRVELEKYLHRLLQYKYTSRERIVQKFLGLNEFVVKDFWIDH